MMDELSPEGEIDEIEGENRSNPYMHFAYQGNSYHVQRIPDSIYSSCDNLEIIDADGFNHGKIFGEFHKDDQGRETKFSSDSISNTQLETTGGTETQTIEKTDKHVPGIVKETIAQMLIQGKVDRWESSVDLLKGGEVMYERLLQDPRLRGKKKIAYKAYDGSPVYEYFLTKRVERVQPPSR